MVDMTRREMVAGSAGTAILASTGAVTPAMAAAANTAAAGDTGQPLWDLAEIYPSDAAWDVARKATIADLSKAAAYQQGFGQSSEKVHAALQAYFDLQKTVSRLYVYVSMKGDQDQAVAQYQEQGAQATELWANLGETFAWLDPALLALGDARLAQLAAEPALAKFHFYLNNLRRMQAHVLSAEGETLLAAAGPALTAFSDIRGQLANVDIPWPTVTLSTGASVRLDDQGYTLNRDAANRADRKLVFDRFWGSYTQYASTFGASYLASVKADVFRMRARKYKTSLEAATATDNVPESVYRGLVAETNRALPVLHRCFRLRQAMLNLPDLHYYDIYPPLVSLDRRFSLSDMRALCIQAFAPLGEDYVARFSQASAARWMDPWPRKGKASGAYMNPGAYDVHPYLLLNLGENYDGLSTYAHEWGHAMHSVLANAAQPYETANYPIFLAEIASTCNEVLLAHTMLAQAKTREEKIFYLGQQLENMRGTFFRQTMFAEFELTVHDRMEAGEGLSSQKLTALYLDLLKRYHGPGVVIDPRYGVEWAYIPHFYNAFYVYQYATSIAAGVWFADQILAGNQAIKNAYLGMLKAGGSDYATEILKRAGLDMASPAPYQGLAQSMSKTIDAIEALRG